jgi:phospholipid/cholesterol/gamma-HCH transport system substrate-binding protein
MSRKADPISIGLFFAIGLALGIAALLVFSSRSLFHPRQKSILYFDATLKGLSPGAPVKFRGVTIGSVVEILIRHNQAANDFSMPVLIAIDKKLAQSKSDELLRIGDRSNLEQLIRQGFRGRLESESLVTGVLYVGLEIVPDAPPPVFHQLKREYEEIPTLPSQIQQLLANLSRVDVQGLSEKLSGLVTRLDTSLSQMDVPQINAGVTNLLGSANRLVTTPDLTNSIVALRKTLDQAQLLLTRVDGRVDPLADSVTNTLHDARKAIADFRAAIQNVSALIGPDSAIPSDLSQALEDLGNAGHAVADLAEFLKRNPNTLLTGRSQPKE